MVTVWESRGGELSAIGSQYQRAGEDYIKESNKSNHQSKSIPDILSKYIYLLCWLLCLYTMNRFWLPSFIVSHIRFQNPEMNTNYILHVQNFELVDSK
jgi:hypothetical protein